MARLVQMTSFTSGKKTVRGEPNPDLRTYEVVTVVHRDDIAEVTGIRDAGRRRELLRTLREQGKLVCNPGRLQHRVRIDERDPRRKAMHYVLACDPGTVPHIIDRAKRPRKYERR